MSSVSLPNLASPWQRELHRVATALRGVRAGHVGIALLVGLLFVALNAPGHLDTYEKFGLHYGMTASSVAAPLIASQFLMLGWLVADAAPAGASRVSRLGVVLLVSALAACLVMTAIYIGTGAADFMDRAMEARGKPPLPLAFEFASELLSILIFGGLGYAFLELLHRRYETQQAFRQLAVRQSSVAQQVLEARLAVMQAQVEPRFLFDTLIDIETLYSRRPAAAAELLDRLIGYLRAALPKLREQGTTLGAELELVRAYVGVVNALHEGRPQLAVTVAEGCAEERFYPMLLIPLVQRAVRNPSSRVPEAIRIGVNRVDGDLAIVLRLDQADGCADDPELARVRERLAGLFAGKARLDCVELDHRTVQLTMRVPNAAGGKGGR